MGLLELPPEVLRLIGQRCIEDSAYMSSLCLVNKYTYHSLNGLLYQSVKLGSKRSVCSFCETVTSLQPSYAKHVIRLQIGVKWLTRRDEEYKLERDLVPQLRRALQCLDYLKDLSLSITRTAFNVLSNDLHVSFRLNRFVHSGSLAAPLLHFLEGQSSITQLGCHGSINSGDEGVLCDPIEKNLNLLPKLQAIEGPSFLVVGLSCIRPITSVTVLSYLDHPLQGVEHRRRTIAALLDHGMIPLTHFCIVSKVTRRSTWDILVKELQRTPPSNLKEITIIDLCSPDLTGRSTNKYIRIFQNLSMFIDVPFPFLEKFEVVTMAHSSRFDPLDWMFIKLMKLYQKDQLPCWKRLCPMLRTVVLYGHVIV